MVRLAWLITAAVVLSLFAAGAVFTYRLLLGEGSPPANFVVPLQATEALTKLGLPRPAAALVYVLFDLFSGVTSFVLGVLLFLRLLSPERSYDRMAMFTAYMLMTYGLLITDALEVIQEGMEPWNTMIALVGFSATVSFVIFLLVFPDGRFALRWTKWMMWALLAWFISWFFFPNLNPGTWPPVYLTLFVAVLLTVAVAAQVYRYLRINTPTQRQQTKWVAFFLVIFVTLGLAELLFENDLPSLDGSSPVWLAAYLVLQAFFNGMEVLFPLILFHVIQRHRLWEIDRLINKALVYGVVTVLLAGLYFASVVILQEIFHSLTGQDNPLAVVASTLGIAAIFNPLRLRVQEFVDRRFYRKHYDAALTLNEFSALAREEMEIEVLTQRLLEVVQATLQPDGAELWLSPVQVRTVIEEDGHRF